MILKILRNTKSAKSRKSKVKVNVNSRDKLDSKNEICDNKIGDNKVGENKVLKKKNIKKCLIAKKR